MSDVAVHVQNLGKKYILQHRGEVRRYKTFRDALTNFPKRLLSHTPFSNHQANDRREEFWALQDVSFEIQQGEAVGIVGRNGAGKSTLLKLLSRITEPTKGRIDLYGRVASLLEVGTGFHPELTGRENIFLNGAILGMSRQEIHGKFDAIVSFAEVERFLDTPVKRYSSGMYMRLAFSVAAHLEPEILIVDEVLAVGDAAFRAKCLGKMDDVTRGGTTVIFVSHDLTAINTLTKKALYLAGGSLKSMGPTPETVALYLSENQDNSLSYTARKEESYSTPYIAEVSLKTSLPANIQINSDPFEIRLSVETPEAIKGACISIQVFDADMANQIHVWTYDANLPMCRSKGRHEIKCVIPTLRLYMGHYRLRVFFNEPPGGRHFETVDGICPFEVIMPTNSRMFQWWPKECTYLEDCVWEARTN